MSLRKREAVIFAVLLAAAVIGAVVTFFAGDAGGQETSAPVFTGAQRYWQLALSDQAMGGAVWNTLWPFWIAAAGIAAVMLPVKRLLSRRVKAVSAGWWDLLGYGLVFMAFLLCGKVLLSLTMPEAGADRFGSFAAVTAALVLCFLLWGGEQLYTYIRSRKHG